MRALQTLYGLFDIAHQDKERLAHDLGDPLQRFNAEDLAEQLGMTIEQVAERYGCEVWELEHTLEDLQERFLRSVSPADIRELVAEMEECARIVEAPQNEKLLAAASYELSLSDPTKFIKGIRNRLRRIKALCEIV